MNINENANPIEKGNKKKKIKKKDKNVKQNLYCQYQLLSFIIQYPLNECSGYLYLNDRKITMFQHIFSVFCFT